MQIVDYSTLVANKKPVFFASINEDEESICELSLFVPSDGQSMGRSIQAISLGASSPTHSSLDTYYKMLEAHDEGETLELTWEDGADNKHNTSTILFTSDDAKFLVYSKADICNLMATMAGFYRLLED